MSMDTEKHVNDWLPAYVLDILTEAEMSQVAEHLSSCRTCQEELGRLQAAADELPLALIQTAPPAELKGKLMDEIHARRTKINEVVHPTFWEQLAAFLRQRTPALGLALIVVLALGNWLLWHQLSQVNNQTKTPMRVIALANTQYSPDATGTIIMDPHGKYGTLVVDNLATLDTGQQYQVWLNQGDQHVSGGVFSVNLEGYASIEILAPLPLSSYDSIGVSVEPAGGSIAPTGYSVLGGSIAQ